MKFEKVYFADFLKENEIPPTKMGYPLMPNDEGNDAKAEGNITKVPLLFDVNDWKFLLQVPPKYWRRALHWRFGEGLLHESEERELNGLDDEILTEHSDKIEFSIGDGKKITILPTQSPECIEAYGRSLQSPIPTSEAAETKQPELYVGYKTLFKRIESPVKVSVQPKDKMPAYCNDPKELQARIDARNQKLPPGPSIDQINLYNSKHPDHAHLRPIEEYPSSQGAGLINGDLTEPFRVTPDLLADKSKFTRENAKHALAGWQTLGLDNASTVLSNWIKGSAFIDEDDSILPSRVVQNENAQKAVKDPLTGQMMPVTMLMPSQFSKNWGDFLGQDDGVSYMHKGNTITAKKHNLTLAAFKRRICYKITGKGTSETICKEEWMPVLSDGHAIPALVAQDESSDSDTTRNSYLQKKGAHLTREQQDAFFERKKRGGGKGNRTKIKNQEVAQKAELGTTSAQKRNEWLTNIGKAENWFNVYDLLHPDQKKYTRENLKNQHHLAAFEHDPEFKNSTDNSIARKWTKIDHENPDEFREVHSGQGDRYLIGGIAPNYSQPPRGFIPTNPEVQDKIFEKYFYTTLEAEATEGYNLYIQALLKKLDKTKKTSSSDEEDTGMEAGMNTSSSGDILGAMEHNKDSIIEIAALLLLTNINTGNFGIYDKDLCLTLAKEGNEQNHNNRVQKAKSIVNQMSQLSLEVGTGAVLPPRRKRATLSGNERAKEAFEKEHGYKPNNEQLAAYINAHPQYRPDRNINNTDIGDETGNQAISTSGRLANSNARVNSAGESTLARPQWLPVKSFGRLSKKFNSVYDQLKILKGKAFNHARKVMEELGENLEDSTSIFNDAFHRNLRQLTNAGMIASDPHKEQMATERAAKELEEHYNLPKWFRDALDDFAEDGITEMEFPNGHIIPLNIDSMPKNKGVLGVVETLANLAKSADSYVDANDTTTEKATKRKRLINVAATVEKYSVRLARHLFPKTPQKEIIEQIKKLGYKPWESIQEDDLPQQKTSQPSPATSIPIQPQQPGKVAAASAIGANPIAALLSDPIGKVNDILNHPEAAKYKSHIAAKLKTMREEIAKKRDAGEIPTSRELWALGRLYGFVNS